MGEFRKITPEIDKSLREKTLDGRKTCFIRAFPYLQVGDIFEIFGATFTVTKLESMAGEDAFRSFYREAGYDSYEELRGVWIASHGNFIGKQQVFVHWFKKVGDT